MKWVLKRIAIIFFVILLSPLSLYASEIEVIPQEVNPGDVLLIKAPAEFIALPVLEFLNRSFSFYPGEEKNLIALIPVDIDTPPGEYTITIRYGEDSKSLSIRVKPYEFPERHLTLPEEKVTLSPENQGRVDREDLMLQSLWNVETPRTWSGRFMPPVDTELSEEFGVRRNLNGKKNSTHKGVDYRGKTGTPVRTINFGTVVLRKDLFYGGNTVVIDHGMGLYSVYMHLSEVHVSKGGQVTRGDLVGLVGMTGRAAGPHLHMSVRLRGVSVNPLSLMNLKL